MTETTMQTDPDLVPGVAYDADEGDVWPDGSVSAVTGTDAEFQYPPRAPLQPLVTDADIAAWTSANDQMAWGQSMIPTAKVTAYVRGLRDRYEAMRGNGS